MRIAILESIIMPAGHEVEFDRILVEELKKQGHTPCFFVPKRFPFKINYGVEINYLDGGEVVTYAGAGRLKKRWLSILREKRRVAWFDAAYAKAKAGKCDAIIIPTATYRYLRTLCKSKLKNSPIPIYFVFHGINPQEKNNFVKQATKCLPYKNIHLRIITLRNDFANSDLSNLQLIELIVQGATAKPEDGAAFEKYAKDYAKYKNIIFWHKILIGYDWQKALLDVDIIIMPYAAERYRYHWSAMLFTAIGFNKPVLLSSEINPEVLTKYNIGMAVQMDNEESFSQQIEKVINNFADNILEYKENLILANKEYSQEALVRNILMR